MAKKKLYDENGAEVKGKLKKPFYKKVWFWVLAILVVGAIGGSLGEDEANTASEPETTPAETTAKEEPKKEEKKKEKPAKETKVYNISDEVNVGKVMYVVNGVETADNVGGEYGQNAKGTYLIVDVTVTNNGEEALTVDDNLFVLKNEGKEYKSDAVAGMSANENGSFFLESINPELSMSGKVVFDVSDAVIESSTKQLQVATGFWGTETELINLQ